MTTNTSASDGTRTLKSSTSAARPGVPSARRVDHMACTVPDLDSAIDFSVRVLGGELVYRLPPMAHDDDWMREHLDVHPRAVAEIALVRLGPTTNLELFAYRSPHHRAVPPRPHDVGGMHLGLYVTDVDAALRDLRDRGPWRPFGPVRTVPAGLPGEGSRWVRVTTPWGIPLELRSVPASLPYERHTPARRFGPCPLWSNRDDGSGTAGRLAGARNVDHLAYTVADLDQAEAFFTEVLGAEPLYRTTADLTAPDLAAALGVPPGGTMHQAALRMGPTDNVELNCFVGSPGARRHWPRNSDLGGNHLALYVDDVDAAAAYLAAQPGCAVLGAPETIPDGPLTGDRWVYVRTAIGLYVEVVRMPDGSLPYEHGTAARRRAADAERWWDR
ncbi:catechol 2,3-dioxygenase-like lactoylglutathione lyase family enzyme [Streptomyces sp. Ag109_O5-1]|uniref:VOC family protein n=1 Tax=Streptomyces sp. Ag109_O5-1 TaxID=1938851 RepID=UPI000FBEB315|nr:VOC family protein [Streptomyces sp. Ag109_O5-1]RPE38953.1 catechol 2,3-dioxygenase-like lactoylglutathione lyase family enzyme [Streptomyces sp. Ag109_O5-1]